MKKNTLSTALISIVGLCAVTIASAHSENSSVTAQDVKKDAQKLLNTLQQYTVEQRDQAVDDAERALRKLDGRIDDLEIQINQNWDNMNQSARQKAEGSLKALRKQRNALAERYGGFKHSSTKAWEQMKEGFSDTYQTMSGSLQEAWSEHETDSK
ncbi:MAG: hypothetical protein ABR578_09415 [Chromatocurvus sp.]